MSYNGSGTFNINTSGQPVVAGTVITATAFNLLTADLATGLTTAMTKDGQTTTTARIPFAQGISSTLVTDATNTTSGSIITAGGVGIAKALYVGTNANVAGTLDVTGTTTLTNPVINNIKMGYTTTATAAGTTTLTVSSNYRQFFTGTTTQTIVLPVTSTLVTGMAYEIENNSTGLLTVNSSGGNLVGTIPAGVCAHAVCIGTTLTTAADWDWDYISTTTITGTGANVLGTSPTITTPTISSLSSAAATALTLQSAGTTAITVDTSQNVGIGTSSPNAKLSLGQSAQNNLLYLFDGTVGAKYGFGIASAELRMYSGTGASTTFGNFDGTTYTERMRIDSSGNLLIGTTSATVVYSGSSTTSSKVQSVSDYENFYATSFNNTSNPAYNFAGKNSAGTVYRYAAIQAPFTTTTAGSEAGAISFQTSNAGSNITERMRITSGGNLLVNNTNITSGKVGVLFNGLAENGIRVMTSYATTGSQFIDFLNSAGTQIGYISQNGASTVNYSTSSDYRLKNTIAPMTGALAKVALLKPVTYKWNADNSDGQGFIAHELQEVIPDCVSGEKDEIDADGNPKYQGIDTSFLVATLTAAIQELKAINDTQAATINALTARIVALETV